MHQVTFTVTATTRGQQYHIYVPNGGDGTAAHLKGSIERGKSYIDTVESGRFPSGRGVSYLLINRFAEYARRAGSQQVLLGTPVNTQSVNQAAVHGQNVAGERAAIHVYTSLGYDASTPEAATTSFRSPSDLRDASAAKIAARWSQFFEVPL